MKSLLFVISIALMMLPSRSAVATVVFDAPVGNSISGPRAFGQTFKVPAGDPVLADFTVRVKAGIPTTFNLKIALWDDPQDRVIAPLLYTSAGQTAPASTDWGELTFTPSLELTPGLPYIGILDNSDFAPPDGLDIGGNFLDAYPDGAFCAPPHTIWDQWIEFANGQDMAFRATFVPEPASLFPICLLLVWTRRRRARLSAHRIQLCTSSSLASDRRCACSTAAGPRGADKQSAALAVDVA